MQITISVEERDTLVETLTTTLSDLRYEIGNTDSYDYRQGLKAKEAKLERVVEALKAASE